MHHTSVTPHRQRQKGSMHSFIFIQDITVCYSLLLEEHKGEQEEHSLFLLWKRHYSVVIQLEGLKLYLSFQHSQPATKIFIKQSSSAQEKQPAKSG